MSQVFAKEDSKEFSAECFLLFYRNLREDFKTTFCELVGSELLDSRNVLTQSASLKQKRCCLLRSWKAVYHYFPQRIWRENSRASWATCKWCSNLSFGQEWASWTHLAQRQHSFSLLHSDWDKTNKTSIRIQLRVPKFLHSWEPPGNRPRSTIQT